MQPPLYDKSLKSELKIVVYESEPVLFIGKNTHSLNIWTRALRPHTSFRFHPSTLLSDNYHKARHPDKHERYQCVCHTEQIDKTQALVRVVHSIVKTVDCLRIELDRLQAHPKCRFASISINRRMQRIRQCKSLIRPNCA